MSDHDSKARENNLLKVGGSLTFGVKKPQRIKLNLVNECGTVFVLG
jgi:hypothetical protein